jgi:hypothetical protein
LFAERRDLQNMVAQQGKINRYSPELTPPGTRV